MKGEKVSFEIHFTTGKWVVKVLAAGLRTVLDLYVFMSLYIIEGCVDSEITRLESMVSEIS
jgi:hypothetical protein